MLNYQRVLGNHKTGFIITADKSLIAGPTTGQLEKLTPKTEQPVPIHGLQV